jgi:hypothetical protein
MTVHGANNGDRWRGFLDTLLADKMELERALSPPRLLPGKVIDMRFRQDVDESAFGVYDIRSEQILMKTRFGTTRDTISVAAKGTKTQNEQIGSQTTGRDAEVESTMSDHAGFGWMLLVLVTAGIELVVILVPSIPRLGQLPGDLRIERKNFRFYFPLVTCLLVSLLLSLVVWIIRLFRS